MHFSIVLNKNLPIELSEFYSLLLLLFSKSDISDFWHCIALKVMSVCVSAQSDVNQELNHDSAQWSNNYGLRHYELHS